MPSNVATETAVSPAKQTLFAITAKLRELFEWRESAKTPEEYVAATAELERITANELGPKTDGYGWFLQQQQDEIDSIETNVIEAAQARIAALKARIQFVRSNMKFSMHQLGAKTMRGAVCTFSLGEESESVDVYDAALLPAEYVRVTPEVRTPDKKALLLALKRERDIEIPGARLKFGDRVLSVTKPHKGGTV